MNTSSINSSTLPPTLMTLPTELISRIFDFLLTGKDLRQIRQFPVAVEGAFCTKRAIHYPFQLAVLRVSKYLHGIARDTFGANNFIMVSRLNPYAVRHIQTWTVEEPDKFSNYRMRLTLVDGHVCGSFLMCIDSLPELVVAMKRVALIQVFSRRTGYHSLFQLRYCADGQSMPSIKLQKQLLEPFTAVKAYKQGCQFEGPWDTTLAQRLQKVMVPKVLWFRARDRELHEVIADRKTAGDENFSAGFYLVAIDIYLEALKLVPDAKQAGRQASRVDDEVFWIRSQSLILSLRCNMLLACLHLKHKRPHYIRADIEETIELLTTLGLDPKSPFNLAHGGQNLVDFHFARLAATVLQGEWSLARQLLAKPPFFPPQSSAYLDYFYNLVLKIMRDHTHVIVVPAPHWALKKVLDTLPTVATAHNIALTNVPAVSAPVDMERYILKQLEYEDDLLEDEVVQKEGWSIDRDGNEVPWEFDSTDAMRYVKSSRKKLEKQFDIPQVVVQSFVARSEEVEDA